MTDQRVAEIARIRTAYESWQRSRYVTAFERNPIGHWGDERGEKYSAPFVQAGWEAWQAAAALRSPLPEEKVARRWRHKKRGTTYTEIGRGTMQVGADTSLVDNELVVVYVAEDGTLWCRPVSEFEDGRFEELPVLSRLSRSQGEEQGKCDTTLTERFRYDGCQCGTYAGNLGPCKTWEPNSDRCVYCDHKIECHNAVATPSHPDSDVVEALANALRNMIAVGQDEGKFVSRIMIAAKERAVAALDLYLERCAALSRQRKADG